MLCWEFANYKRCLSARRIWLDFRQGENHCPFIFNFSNISTTYSLFTWSQLHPSSSVLGIPHHPNLENVFQLQEEEVNQGHFFYRRIKCVQFATTRCAGAPLNWISHRSRPKYSKIKYSRTKRSSSYNIKFYTNALHSHIPSQRRTRSKIPRPHSKYRIAWQG